MSEIDVKLGYIGLGKQGAPMAKQLVDWPGGLIVFDIRAEAMAPFAETGAQLAESVADVAEADIVSITVLNDEQVREVVGALLPTAKAGTVLAIHSTISDTTAVELAEELRHEAGGGKRQRRCVVRHFIGPQHHVAAEQRAGVVQKLRADQQGLFVPHNP